MDAVSSIAISAGKRSTVMLAMYVVFWSQLHHEEQGKNKMKMDYEKKKENRVMFSESIKLQLVHYKPYSLYGTSTYIEGETFCSLFIVHCL